MAFRSLAILATLGLATAQTSVVSVFLPDTDPQPIVASIAGESADKTTYFIQCPKGEPSDECGLGTGMTLIAGPSTAGWEYNMSPAFSGKVDCSVGGTTTAVCTASLSGEEITDGGVTTTTLQKSDINFIPITVTAGALKGASAATTTAKSTESAASSGSSTEAQASSTASSTLSSGTSTGGIPQMTGNAGLVMGGLAVAVAAAAL